LYFLAFVAPSVDSTDRYGPVITVGGVGGDFSQTQTIDFWFSATLANFGRLVWLNFQPQ